MKIQTMLCSLTVVILFIITPQSSAYKILFVMSMGTKSHMNFFNGALQALANKGHEITIVSPFKAKVNGTINQIVLNEDYSEKLSSNAFQLSTFKMGQMLIKHTPQACVKALTQTEVVEALEKHYDVMLMSLFFTDCFLSYSHERQIPFVYLSPNTIMSPHSEKFGLPEFPSVSPNKMIPFTYPLSFWNRVGIAAAGFLMSQTSKLFLDRGVENLCREMRLWTDQTPPIQQLQRKASLAIINGIRALEVPIKSIPPSIIYAGGIHIKHPEPLPKNIEDWIEGSGEHGFILFSLGTAVKPSQMKPEHLRSILGVFRTLKERILWKWDADSLQDFPSNVLTSPWLPQQDILAHPKIRLFITHGGLFSIQESTYFGVPVIAMPVFGDQTYNAAEIEAEGWGQQVRWEELTEEKFRTAIQETLSNDRFRKAANSRSQIMKDWPRNPSQEVSYWVEYVIRHKGAMHLQSPLVHLSWYQIYNVDVWLVLIAVLLAVLIGLVLLIRTCFRFCFRKCFKRKVE